MNKARFYKQSIFGYIIPVDGVTRLKVYNCSNITGLEKNIHRLSQVVVEIPSRGIILFIGDTFHAGVSTFERRNGNYPSNLRIFSYIVEDDFLSINENITSIKGNMLCTNYQACLNMTKENMHYPGHIIKFGMSLSGIETLGEGTILMGNLEKVGWVRSKSGYSITPYGELENELYHLNNDSAKFKKKLFAIEGIYRKKITNNQRIFMIQGSLTVIFLKFMHC